MKVIRAAAAALGGAVLVVLRVLAPLYCIRIGLPRVDRIGHMRSNTEFWLRARSLEGPQRGLDVLVAPREVANEQVALMIGRRAPLFRGKLLYYVFYQAQRAFPDHPQWLDFSDEGCYSPHIYTTALPQLGFTEAEQERGRILEARLGIAPGQPYACFGARDSGYLLQAQPERSWSYHDYRDSDITTYLPAIRMLVRRGYRAIRMGSVVSAGLPEEEGIVDYSNGYRSEFGDVWLMANCSLFVGDTAGLNGLATAADVPTLVTNLIPMAQAPWGARTIHIPKLYRRQGETTLLRFDEVAAAGILGVFQTEKFAEAGVEIVDSSPEDIREAVEELLSRMDGSWCTQAEDEVLSCRYMSVFPRSHPIQAVKCQIACSFLRRHADLLPPVTPLPPTLPMSSNSGVES